MMLSCSTTYFFSRRRRMVRLLRMYYRRFLVVALLSSFSGISVVHAPLQTVWVFVGGDAILPCSFNANNGDLPTVEWSKEGLQPSIVFLYRDGCEIHEMKNQAFEYRTSFNNSELQNRDISLRISNVQLSDAGKYQCKTLWKNVRDLTTVQLVVGAVSEPKLSVVSAESGGVNLQCEATCWLPHPEITFLDDREKEIPADDPRTHQDTSGCYTVTRKVTLRDATNSVTCRVQQPKTNQTRNAKILIPVDCMRSCSVSCAITSGVTNLLLLAACASAAFVWMKCRKPVADLKSQPHETEEMLHQPKNSSPQPSPTVDCPDQPTLSSNSDSTHSISHPNDEEPCSSFAPGDVGRSKSMSYSLHPENHKLFYRQRNSSEDSQYLVS